MIKETKFIDEFPCLVCGEFCEVRTAKTGKPHILCVDCGIQIFFREQAGIDRLEEFRNNPRLVDKLGNSLTNSPLIKLSKRILRIETKIGKLKKKDVPWATDKIRNKLTTLITELVELEDQYFQLLKNR